MGASLSQDQCRDGPFYILATTRHNAHRQQGLEARDPAVRDDRDSVPGIQPARGTGRSRPPKKRSGRKSTPISSCGPGFP